MPKLRHDMRTIVIAVIAGSLSAATPTIARTVVDFARNADKVDGFHAKAADARRQRNALVATDERGKLPVQIIPPVSKARNADRLGGASANEYQAACGLGTVLGAAFVPGTPQGGANEYTTVGNGFSCERDVRHDVLVRHIATGTYNVYFPPFGTGFPSDIAAPPPVTAVVTPGAKRFESDQDDKLFANYLTEFDTVLGSRRAVVQISIYDVGGTPRDSSFAIALLSP